MIKKNTLLILGAGASVDFRFPVGSDLLWEIKDFLKEETKQFYALCHAGFDESEIQLFRKALRYEDTSIDSFLEWNKEFVNIGKVSIALALLPYEKTEYLLENAKDRKRNWYQLLFNSLSENCPFDEFQDNKLQIITFNYDRSLEQFLYHRIQSKYHSESKEDCAAKVRNIPIIHVHGRLGRLPWQKPEYQDEKIIKYDSYENYKSGIIYPVTPDKMPDSEHRIVEVYKQKAVDSSESIKIIHHEVQSFEEKNVYNLINEAKEIHFLGFGFYPKNLERLDIKGNRSAGLSIYSTAYDCTAEQEETIAKFEFRQLQFFLRSDNIDKARKIDIYDYLKYHNTFK